MRSLKPIALSILLFSQFASPVVAFDSLDEYWPHSQSPTSILEKGLGPQDSEVSLIINNRPILLGSDKHKDRSAVSAELSKALSIARQARTESSPVLVATRPIEDLPKVKIALARASNPNLSMSSTGGEINIYYKPPAGFQASSDVLVQALQALAVVHFKARQYPDAVSALEECLEVQKKRDPNSLAVTDSLDFLALVYRSSDEFDKAESSYLKSLAIRQKTLSSTDPAIGKSYMHLADLYYDKGESERALKLRKKAESLMETSQIRIAKRPVPTSISAPTYNCWPDIIATGQGITEAHKNHQAAVGGEIEAIKALIRSLLPEENSYIYGTAQCPIDRTDSLVFNKSIREPQGGKTEKEAPETGKTKVSDLKGFPVVLCSSQVKLEIDGVIASYARQYGFNTEDYLKNWPGIREQAAELILNMVPVVNRLSPRIEETNNHGEFEMKEVKKGDYYVFGYLVTSSVAMYWLQRVPITGRGPFRVDFLRDNAIILWEKNKVAPTTQPLIPATGSAGTFLVPPPPPVIPGLFPSIRN
jgi:tetratricopeptide (TPR) repeat protein